MRQITKFDTHTPLRIDPARLALLEDWLTEEMEAAMSALNLQHALYREMLRMYEGVPKQKVRNTPIENAPNIEITLGAIAADSIYAQSMDLIYAVNPILTVRPTNTAFKDHAKAVQKFANFVATNEAGLREASEHAILDDIQLGTGIYYIPWNETIKKTKIAKVLSAGPRIQAVPIEDFIVPGGSKSDLQELRWCSMRTWPSKSELMHMASLQKRLKVDEFVPVGTVGWVRSRREQLGRTSSSKTIGELYEVHRVYAYFDIDGDGILEDLFIVWDRTSRKIGYISYNPFDYRPFSPMRYQIRGHLFYGIGVVEMVKPFQEETTETHNHRVLNMMLANCRLWASKNGALPVGSKIWPNKIVEMTNDGDLQALQLGEVYPSSAFAESFAISLAERRVGVNDLSTPRPSAVMGSRTPGITALSLLQQANRRFTPAFDGMRLGTADAMKQCLYRYQEKVKAQDVSVVNHILEVCGHNDGRLVIQALNNDKFDEAVALEMTASSTSVNKDADKQNAMLLVNILSTYYEKTLMLVQIASNPGVPEPIRTTAQKIAAASAEIIDRTIRTFDQVRDPETFIIDINEQLDQVPGLENQGLQGLGQIMAAMQQQMGGQAGTPEGGVVI